jgi:hypothetical protein
MPSLARKAIKDALFARLSACHAWRRPIDSIKSTNGLQTPTFMLSKTEEQAQYPQTYGPPHWFLTFGMIVYAGPTDDMDTLLGEIEECLESVAGEDQQWQTTLTDLVDNARISSVEIYETEGNPIIEALVMIDVAANTKP